MNATEILNYLGTCFVNFALPMLAQSSLLILVLYGLDRLLRRRLRAVARHALWMLILVKLLLPPSFASPTGLAYWLPISQATGSRARIPIREVVRHIEVQVDSPMLSAPKQSHLAGPWLSWPALLLIGWAVGAVGLFAWLIRCSRYVGRQVKAATDASGELFALLKECGEQMSRILVSAHPRSPGRTATWPGCSLPHNGRTSCGESNTKSFGCCSLSPRERVRVRGKQRPTAAKCSISKGLLSK